MDVGSAATSTKNSALSSARSSRVMSYTIGANVGFYTLLSSVLTGDQGRVCAFEPLPSNLRDLREAAVAHASLNRSEGRLSATGTIVVRTVALEL
jgi:FkbM family methyltransferase